MTVVVMATSPVGITDGCSSHAQHELLSSASTEPIDPREGPKILTKGAPTAPKPLDGLSSTKYLGT